MLTVRPLLVATVAFAWTATASWADEHPQTLDERIQYHETTHSILKNIKIGGNYLSYSHSFPNIIQSIELG